MSATPNKKFGTLIYEMAEKRANTKEGELEMSGYSKEQFLETLKRLCAVLDELPDNYSLHSLYLSMNYIGSFIVAIMEANRDRLKKATIQGNG